MKWKLSKNLSRSEFGCEKWLQTEPSATLADQGRGQHDRYVVSLGKSYEDLLFNKAIERLLLYQIFPPSRMRAHICNSDHRLIPGATIVQQVFLGPIGFEAAVRIVEFFDGEVEGERKVAFTYATLKGHPECGISTFSVSQDKRSGEVCFTIESWSRPGNHLALFFRPLARLIQKRSVHQALEYFRNTILHA